MSNIYTESNFESSGDLFKKRTMYRIKSKRSVRGTKNIVNFTIGEKMLYGKVTKSFSPIFMKYDSNLKTLRNSEGNMPLKAINFVADLFNEMCLEFDKCAAKGQIDVSDPFLSSLKVFKAFQDPTKAYKEYREILFQQIASNFEKFNIQVESFEHFMEEFMKMANRSATATPYTMSAFIKSDLNPIFTTGLAIEIADLKYSDDKAKVEKFIQSKNWDFFVNACNKYGFMIDYNIPWRIVCDVKAPEIATVRNSYYSTVDLMFGQAYSRASLESFISMPAFLLDLYNRVKKKKFVKQVICGKKITKKTIVPESYTREELLLKYGLTYFLRTYVKLRLLEEKPKLDNETKNFMIKDLLEYVNLRDDFLAVENYFEIFINKPFDKHYSHTYNINVVYPAVKPIFEGATQQVNGNAVQSAMMSY